MHLAQVDDVTGQPHALVVVEVAGIVEFAHRRINHRNAGGRGQNVTGHTVAVVDTRQRVTDVAQYAVAKVAPDVPEKLAPRQFLHEPVGRPGSPAGNHSTEHFWNAHEAMGDVRRDARDWTADIVTKTSVAARVQPRNPAQGLVPTGRKSRVERNKPVEFHLKVVQHPSFGVGRAFATTLMQAQVTFASQRIGVRHAHGNCLLN